MKHAKSTFWSCIVLDAVMSTRRAKILHGVQHRQHGDVFRWPCDASPVGGVEHAERIDRGAMCGNQSLDVQFLQGAVLYPYSCSIGVDANNVSHHHPLRAETSIDTVQRPWERRCALSTRTSNFATSGYPSAGAGWGQLQRGRACCPHCCPHLPHGLPERPSEVIGHEKGRNPLLRIPAFLGLLWSLYWWRWGGPLKNQAEFLKIKRLSAHQWRGGDT